MKETFTIDGFTFEKKYNDVSDRENLNYFLEKKFNDFYIKDFMSRRHPELFPGHIGLYVDLDGTMSVAIWEFNYDTLEYADRGWDCYRVREPEKYIDDILEFYQKNDSDFYNFIKDRIVLS